MKLIEFHSYSYGRVMVNPDQVQYVRGDGGQTRLIFGAFPGGFHELMVAGPAQEAVALLEGEDRLTAMRIGIQGRPSQEKRPPKTRARRPKPPPKA